MPPLTSNSRSLHLVDIENLIGSPRPTRGDVARCRDQYRELLGSDDQVVVACNHGAFVVVGWIWDDVRHLVRSGVDGADHALLDVLEHERVTERFGSVVVASGDGIFAEPIGRLAGVGIDVTVVSRPDALSRRLRLAARNVRFFVDEPETTAAVCSLTEIA